MAQHLTKTFYVGFAFNLSFLCLFTSFIIAALHYSIHKMSCYTAQIQGYNKSDTTCLIKTSPPLVLFFLIHLLVVFLLLLTPTCTFQHAEHGLLDEAVVIEDHFTDVEAAIFPLRCEQKGEATGLCIVGWAGELEFLAVLSRGGGAPPAIVLVHQSHFTVPPAVWRLPPQTDIVPLDNRTGQGEGYLSLSGGGDISFCRQGGKRKDQGNQNDKIDETVRKTNIKTVQADRELRKKEGE